MLMMIEKARNLPKPETSNENDGDFRERAG